MTSTLARQTAVVLVEKLPDDFDIYNLFQPVQRIKTAAMIKASDCSTCKHRGKCEYEAILESWRYLGTNCNLWEKWNASDAT